MRQGLRGFANHPLLYVLAFIAFGALALAPAAQAQDGNIRVFKSWDEPVKLQTGTTTYHVDIVFDYNIGEPRRRVFDAAGTLLEDTVIALQPHPRADEAAEAFSLLEADDEFGPMILGAGIALEGGFILREADGPCGPGTRCLQIDMLAPKLAGERYRQSLRFVVIDLVAQRIVYRNYLPH
jgi:hypothetical protein